MELTIKQVKLVLFFLGISTSIIQVLILRLFLSVFYSNELIIGVFLALWMSLTGMGSWLGIKKTKKNISIISVLTLLLSYSFFALVAGSLMGFIKTIFVPAGVLINTWQLILLILSFLMPVCICSGYTFRIFTSFYPNYGAENYSSETAGSIVGGIVVTFTVVLFLEPLQTLALVLAMNIVLFSILFIRKRIKKYVVIVLAFSIPLLFFIFRIDIYSRTPLFKNQKIIESCDTPYGTLTITENAGQKYLFSNMVLQYSGEDIEHYEESAHFPALQHGCPRNVMLVSGAYWGIVPEILKYPSVKQVVHIEPNPWFLNYAEKYFNSSVKEKLKTIHKDPRQFLLSDTTHYDVMIMDVPEPSTLQANRYFTFQFIKLLKEHSKENTVVGYSLATSGNYLSQENIRLHSILYNTLHSVFTNVLIVPGNRNYFLASDNPLSLDYEALYKSNTIETLYVNPYYMNNQSLRERSESIQKNIDLKAPVNKDFNPMALWAQTLSFFSLFNVNSVLLIIIMALLILVPLSRFDLVSYTVFITGFTASSLEMLILITFQIIFGFLYAATGIIFAVFMGGLSLGALQQKKRREIPLFTIQFIFILVVLVVCTSLLFLTKINSPFFLYPTIGVITFVPAYLTGYQFALALKKLSPGHSNKTGYLYGVDLFGSALGLLLISTILIPVLGFVTSGLILVSMNLIITTVLYLRKK